jgi:hypothetical protein
MQEMEGLPVENQRLIYKGKQLENEMTLAYYSIRAQATLHTVLRLTGC